MNLQQVLEITTGILLLVVPSVIVVIKARRQGGL